MGKQLFFDRRLSGSEQLACASCHDPELGWTDARRKSIGHNRSAGNMNAPTILNSGYLKLLFWDGRVTSLEEQTLSSWLNPIEMAGKPEQAVQKLQQISGYAPLFTDAFGDSTISQERIILALATFSRSLSSTNSPYDKFLSGNMTALSDTQIRGLHLFRTKARCINCHHGALLSDEDFHHLGSSFHTVGNFKGRYNVTGQIEHIGAFRTPALRNVAFTAPYLHNGIVPDLDSLLAIYNSGWWQNEELTGKTDNLPIARLSPLIKPLSLTDNELADLKAFLISLSGATHEIPVPKELPKELPKDKTQMTLN